MDIKLIKDPANLGPYYSALIAVFFICISWLFIFLRFYVRIFRLRSLGNDDITAFLSQICFTSYCISYILLDEKPFEERAGDMISLRRSIDLNLASGVLYSWSMLLIKFSLGLSFLRILHSPKQRIAAYSIIILSTIVNFTNAWFILFCCGSPIQYATKILDGQCSLEVFQIKFMMYFQAAANIVVDIGLLVLPLSTIINSTMNIGAKIPVIFIFLLACSGTICSMARVYFLTTFFESHFRNGSMGAILSIIEAGIFITAGCLATMRVLLPTGLSKPRAGNAPKLKQWYTTSDTHTDRSKTMDSHVSGYYNGVGQGQWGPGKKTEHAPRQTL